MDIFDSDINSTLITSQFRRRCSRAIGSHQGSFGKGPFICSVSKVFFMEPFLAIKVSDAVLMGISGIHRKRPGCGVFEFSAKLYMSKADWRLRAVCC